MATKSNLTRPEAAERADLVRDVSYRISLDLTGDRDFGSISHVRFRCSRPGSATFLELMAHDVKRIECNGLALPASAQNIAIVNGKPAERVTDLRKVEQVLRAGRLYDARDLQIATGLVRP